MTLLIRNARGADVALIADVLQMAGRGHLPGGPWDLLLPDSGKRRRGLEYLAGSASRSWCHHSLFHVAEDAGEACAALVAFEAEELGDPSLVKPLFETLQVLEWPAERIATVGPLLAPYLRCFPDMPAGTWIVENVGTRADRRRRGFVGALLEHALEIGRERGYVVAQISCLVGNEPAQRAYEKVGFEVCEERRDAEFERAFGAPGFSRMTLALKE